MCPSRSAEKIPLADLAKGSSEAQGGPGPARVQGLCGQRALVHVTSRLRLMKRFTPRRGPWVCRMGQWSLFFFCLVHISSAGEEENRDGRAGGVSLVSSLPSLQELHAAEVRRNKEQREEISG